MEADNKKVRLIYVSNYYEKELEHTELLFFLFFLFFVSITSFKVNFLKLLEDNNRLESIRLAFLFFFNVNMLF